MVQKWQEIDSIKTDELGINAKNGGYDLTLWILTLESGQIDQKPYVQIGWVLRETTCWNEYAFLDSPDQVCFISNAKEKIRKKEN